MKYITSLLILFTLLNPTEPPKLTIKISNIQSMKGEIKVGIFSTEAAFLKEGKALKNYSIKAEKTSLSFTVADLPKGEYAISMYHDENSDQKMNTNFIGIPKEPYGFSNNVKPKMSAPKFKECKFNFQENTTLNIKLIR